VRGNKGSILMIAMWVMAILVIFTLGLGHRASINLRLAKYQKDRLKAAYLAKAGISKAIAILQEDKNTPQTSGYDSLNEIWSILWQLLNGICHMIQRKVAHIDIKPANIGITFDPAITAKIFDFGSGKEFNQLIQQPFGLEITEWFAPPELLLKHKEIIPEKIDLYSLGRTIFFHFISFS